MEGQLAKMERRWVQRGRAQAEDLSVYPDSCRLSPGIATGSGPFRGPATGCGGLELGESKLRGPNVRGDTVAPLAAKSSGAADFLQGKRL